MGIAAGISYPSMADSDSQHGEGARKIKIKGRKGNIGTYILPNQNKMLGSQLPTARNTPNIPL